MYLKQWPKWIHLSSMCAIVSSQYYVTGRSFPQRQYIDAAEERYLDP